MIEDDRPPVYGIVGLGAMGGGMAAALIAAGHPVRGLDPDRAAQARARARGVFVEQDLSSLLDSANIVIVCLATPKALTDVYATIAATPANQGQMVVECSTIAPDRARDLAAVSRASGRRHLEACMIGLGDDAAAGRLYYFVGGDMRDLDAARSFLEATGRGFAHLGDVGSGAAAKVLNNAIGNATMLAFTEAIVAGEAIGLDAKAFVCAVAEAKGAGMSVVFERRAHWAVSEEAQPPGPLNRKDMLEWGRMMDERCSEYPILSESLRVFSRMPEAPGPIRAYAELIKSRLGV
ncbi:NAD(P)-dependent oxidoreductase [Bauldia sp.]|uniref:NAD(P)-dependent oxidoreductase n=1 Tax=Bauldia sp. TaxID=2575872 RepID=UPI003BACDE51